MEPTPRKHGAPLVRRITVDEILEEGLARFLVAGLAEGVEEIPLLGRDPWRDEQEELVAPEAFLAPQGEETGDPTPVRDFLRVLGLADNVPLLPRAVEQVVGKADQKTEDNGRLADRLWRNLREGQVFLAGAFEAVGDKSGTPRAVRVRDGAYDFLRIDRIDRVRQAAKQLYSEALRGKGESDAKPDHAE